MQERFKKDESSVRVLLTGSSGLVGSDLLGLLQRRKFQVIHPSSAEVDLLNQGSVNEMLERIKPDVVIHCAGKVGGIQANINNQLQFCLDNMLMGINLIRSSLECDVPNFVNLGSSCMYPTNALNPLSESDILSGPLEPTNEGYGVAKVAVAQLAEYCDESTRGTYKTIIPCNLFGENDDFDPKTSHMIPGVIKKLYDAKEQEAPQCDIWGDGEARREFMYVGNLSDFIVSHLDGLETLPKKINVGMGEDFSINEYYQIIAKVVGYNGSFFHDLQRPSGMRQKLVDTKQQEALGWKPPISLLEGIERTYKAFLASKI